MSLDALIRARQSCRAYDKNRPVEASVLRRIAERALLAPSACNSQPWRIYMVTSPEAVAAVAEAVQDHGMNRFASTAPAFAVIVEGAATLKPSSSLKFASDHFVKYDVGELVAYLTLAAKEEGVDSCIIGWTNQEKLRAVLGYGEGERAALVICLGYGTDAPRPKTRKPTEETLFFI